MSLLRFTCLNVLETGLVGALSRGSRRERLLSKFMENEFEKIDRLMELYIRFV